MHQQEAHAPDLVVVRRAVAHLALQCAAHGLELGVVRLESRIHVGVACRLARLQSWKDAGLGLEKR